MRPRGHGGGAAVAIARAGHGLFNLMRQHGGSVGSALMAALPSLLTRVEKPVLTEHVGVYDPVTTERIAAITRGLTARGTDAFLAKQQASMVLDRQIGWQASVLAFSRLYLISGILLVGALPLLLICRTGRSKLSVTVDMHQAGTRFPPPGVHPCTDVFPSRLPVPAMPTRDAALFLMHAWTQSESLRKHMLAVECAMRAYAVHFGEDPESWGLAGLIHDFDYEKFPNNAQGADVEHPAEGVRYLRAEGWPADICEAVLGHANYTGVPRVTRLAQALFAVDELTGLITASALVKPSKAVTDVDVTGVKKKMKDKAFARGVNRDDIVQGARALGVPLDTHIALVLEAMQAQAAALGLVGVPVVVAHESPNSTPVSTDA